MSRRIKVKSGDQVKVIAGAYKGKEGRVIEVHTKTNRVLIEGVNMITKHVKPSATTPQGSIEKKEAPIHVSNVMVIDNQGVPTRVGRVRGDNGKLERFSKKSQQVIK